MSPDRNLLVFAGFNGAMAVALGAFAAHGAAPAVKTLLTTGGQYQMVHAALAVALALWNSVGRLARLASGGGLVFCLALAMIGLLSLPAMGAIAPIGGVMMIAAWCLIVAAALKPSPTNV